MHWWLSTSVWNIEFGFSCPASLMCCFGIVTSFWQICCSIHMNLLQPPGKVMTNSFIIIMLSWQTWRAGMNVGSGVVTLPRGCCVATRLLCCHEVVMLPWGYVAVRLLRCHEVVTLPRGCYVAMSCLAPVCIHSKCCFKTWNYQMIIFEWSNICKVSKLLLLNNLKHCMHCVSKKTYRIQVGVVITTRFMYKGLKG